MPLTTYRIKNNTAHDIQHAVAETKQNVKPAIQVAEIKQAPKKQLYTVEVIETETEVRIIYRK